MVHKCSIRLAKEKVTTKVLFRDNWSFSDVKSIFNLFSYQNRAHQESLRLKLSLIIISIIENPTKNLLVKFLISNLEKMETFFY